MASSGIDMDANRARSSALHVPIGDVGATFAGAMMASVSILMGTRSANVELAAIIGSPDGFEVSTCHLAKMVLARRALPLTISGMIRKICCPMAWSTVPKESLAPRFHEVMMPPASC